MDSLSLIKLPIAQELTDFRKLFDSSLTSSNLLLNNVLKHIQQRNGKMMRPILVLLVARLYGQVQPATLHAAVSLELLHTASLLHDDVVDESTERRGQLSVNAIFNNKASVLAGDYLLAASLVNAGLTQSYPIINVISTLGKDLAEGELLQLSNISNPEFSESVYFEVIYKKTATLFASCTRAAALSVGASDKMVEHSSRFGEYIGICFQIKDDVFDYFQDSAIGKPTGNDMLEGKLTLPVLYVLNKFAHPHAKEVATRVKEGLATADEITYLVNHTKEHGGIEYAFKVMDDYKEKALALLQDFPESDVRTALQSYLDYVVRRNK